MEPVITDNTWTLKNGILFPNNKENSIKYKISDINSTAYDVCLNITYNSSQTVELKLNYKFESQTIELRIIPLLKTADDQVDFCLGDFYNSNRENLTIELKVISNAENFWDENGFQLKTFKPSLVKKKDPVPYLNRWDKVIAGTDPPINQYWKAFPESMFKKLTDKEVLDLELKGNLSKQNTMTKVKTNDLVIFLVTIDSDTPQKVYLISDWIRNDNNFKTSENFYSLLYTKNSFSNKDFQLKQHVIYVENDLIVRKSRDFSENNPEEEGED